MRLKIKLHTEGAITHLLWTRRWLATTPAADAWIAAYTDEAFTTMMTMLQATLTHYLNTGLRTGESLRP